MKTDFALWRSVPLLVKNRVAKLAKEQSAKAILISGGLGSGCEELYDYFVSCHSISTGPIAFEESMQYPKIAFSKTKPG
jgi:hypothetical protein